MAASTLLYFCLDVNVEVLGVMVTGLHMGHKEPEGLTKTSKQPYSWVACLSLFRKALEKVGQKSHAPTQSTLDKMRKKNFICII